MPTIKADLEFPDALVDQRRYTAGVERQQNIIGKALMNGPLADLRGDILDNIFQYPKDFSHTHDLLKDALGCFPDYPNQAGKSVEEALYVAYTSQQEIPVKIEFDIGVTRYQGEKPEYHPTDITAVIANVQVNTDALTARDMGELENACECWIEENLDKLDQDHAA